MADNFIQDQKKDAFDEYNNGGEGPDVDVRDEELADPRAYQSHGNGSKESTYYVLSLVSDIITVGLSLSILEDVNIPLVVIAISLPRRRSNA